MNTYNEKLYEFLIKEENFDAYIDMVKQFQEFRRVLITDFWRDVEKKLNSFNTTDWKVWLSEDVLHQNSKVGFYHDDYTDKNSDHSSCTIIFEGLGRSPVYGLWFNRYEKVQNIAFEKVCEEVRNEHKAWKPGSGGWWFAAYQTTEEDFSLPSELTKISPKNRESLVDEYSRVLISALNEFAPIGMKYARNFKQ